MVACERWRRRLRRQRCQRSRTDPLLCYARAVAWQVFGVDTRDAPYFVGAGAMRLQRVTWTCYAPRSHSRRPGLRRNRRQTEGRCGPRRGERQVAKESSQTCSGPFQRLRAGQSQHHAAVRKPRPGADDLQGARGDKEVTDIFLSRNTHPSSAAGVPETSLPLGLGVDGVPRRSRS